MQKNDLDPLFFRQALQLTARHCTMASDSQGFSPGSVDKTATASRAPSASPYASSSASSRSAVHAAADVGGGWGEEVTARNRANADRGLVVVGEGRCWLGVIV